MFIEFFSFIVVVILIGAIIQNNITSNKKKYVMESPKDIAMVRLLYMYKDMLLENDPVKKMKLLEQFEDSLLDFISQYEEYEVKSKIREVNENVRFIDEFKKIGQ